MRHVGRHMSGALRCQQPLALYQGPTALHQIIHNDYVAPARHAFLQTNDAFVSVSHLCADDLWVITKLVMEALPGTFVRVGDCDIVGVGKGSQTLSEQRDPGLEERQHLVPEIKSLLESVDVKDDHRGGTPTSERNIGNDTGEGERRGDVAFCFYSLSSSCGKVREYEAERANEQPGELINDGDLLEDNSRVVERSQKGDVPIANSDGISDVEVWETVGKASEWNRGNVFRMDMVVIL